jgi:hypothetical protein
MKYAVINDPEKSFVAIGKTRLSFSSIIEELIDNGIDWESKRTLNCSINVSRIDDDNIKVDYKDNSEGIESEKIPEALSIGNQLNKNNLHCHGFGLSCVLAVLQQTHKTNNWEIRTCGKLVKGPIGKEIEITDDDRNTNGLNMTFVYPIKNLKTLATHKNTKSIKRFMMGLSSTPRSFRTLKTDTFCSSMRELSISTTCKSTSACITSSSVALKLSIR